MSLRLRRSRPSCSPCRWTCKIVPIGKCLDSTYSGLKTMQQVSRYLSDLEMNWTSGFLFWRDKLAIVPHLLLAPVGTVVKPAEHEVAHRLGPIPGASRCFALNCRSTLFIDCWRDKGLTRQSSCSVNCPSLLSEANLMSE